MGNEAAPVQPTASEDNDAKQNQIILRSRDCVHRMEIASLIRYAFLKTCRGATGRCKSLLFFTPCEELNGGSIFQKLAANYNLIQPYIDKIDAHFIDYLNYKIRNINHYLSQKCVAVSDKTV